MRRESDIRAARQWRRATRMRMTYSHIEMHPALIYSMRCCTRVAKRIFITIPSPRATSLWKKKHRAATLTKLRARDVAWWLASRALLLEWFTWKLCAEKGKFINCKTRNKQYEYNKRNNNKYDIFRAKCIAYKFPSRFSRSCSYFLHKNFSSRMRSV